MKKVLFFVLCLASLTTACTGNPGVTKMDTTASEEELVVTEDENNTGWTYSETVDEMTDKTCYMASVVSENSAEFGFPYDGGSFLTFVIRDSPQYGKDMFIAISKGQFNCSFNGEDIKIRFDSNEAFTVHCNGPSDMSQDYIFLNQRDFNKILKLLKESKTMKINVEFFNEGAHTFTFNVEGLEWNH